MTSLSVGDRNRDRATPRHVGFEKRVDSSTDEAIKNALDYAEDTAKDARPYLDGRAVGCIACAYGWQATDSTLIAMRSIVHALRGWPTPLGVAANTTM